jgi:O-methyltransferase
MSSKTSILVLKKLKIDKLLKPLRKYLPAKFKAWYKLNTVKDVISVDQLKPQYEKACKYFIETIGKDSIGDYLEFGVFRGTSISCMHEVLKNFQLNDVRIFGFDSFEGMPDISKTEDKNEWYPGQFRSELEDTKYYLSQKGIDWKKTFLIKGWFSDTLTDDFKTKHNITKASVIMIDCDIYVSAKEALNFCKSLIVDKSILVFDDWNSGNLAEQNLGEKRAFDEFLKENPNFIAEEFGSYYFRDVPNGKLFLVTNTEAK